MKPEIRLKEALKPPFEAVAYPAGEYVADSNHQPVCCLLSNNKYLVYKGIVGLTKKFIVDALNEKWERDFEEPLRWTEESTNTVRLLLGIVQNVKKVMPLAGQSGRGFIIAQNAE